MEQSNVNSLCVRVIQLQISINSKFEATKTGGILTKFGSTANQAVVRQEDPRTTPNESRSRKSRGTRADGDKSAWTPGEIDGNTIRRDQRTLYKLKQISRLIIINPRAALIIERRPRRPPSSSFLSHRSALSSLRSRERARI